MPHAHAWLAQVLIERGELDDASALLGNVEPLIDVASDPFSSTPLLRARSMLAAARGDHRAALDDALELGRALTAFGHVNPAASHPPWRSLAAIEHHALGETERGVGVGARGGRARARRGAHRETWAGP